MNSRSSIILLLLSFALLPGCNEDREITKNLADEIVGFWSQIQSIDSNGNDVTNANCSIQLDLTSRESGEVFESGSECSGNSANNGTFEWEVDEGLRIITFQRTGQDNKTAFFITLTRDELQLKQSGAFQPRTLVFMRK